MGDYDFDEGLKRLLKQDSRRVSTASRPGGLIIRSEEIEYEFDDYMKKLNAKSSNSSDLKSNTAKVKELCKPCKPIIKIEKKTEESDHDSSDSESASESDDHGSEASSDEDTEDSASSSESATAESNSFDSESESDEKMSEVESSESDRDRKRNFKRESRKLQRRGKRYHAGRSSSSVLKRNALKLSFHRFNKEMKPQCHANCCRDRKCTTRVSWEEIMETRTEFFGELSQRSKSPRDSDRRNKLISILLEQGSLDEDDELFIRVGKHKVCPTAWLRILGLLHSPDLNQAPGQARKLIRARRSSSKRSDLEEACKAKQVISEKLAEKKQAAKAYITKIALHYSDTIPSVASKDRNVLTKQLPFRTKRDFYLHWKYECETNGEPYYSESTFKRAYEEMYEEDLVQLLGGKSGFNTCSICNELLTLKKNAAKDQDPLSFEVTQHVHKLHLKLQQRERQHAENYIHLAKTLYVNGLPSLFYICLDGMTNETTKAPRVSKDRSHEHNKMECRNMGARIVCGPIDEYICICMPDYIPGGANVLIECARIAIEILAQKLADCKDVMGRPAPLPLPFTGGFNFDNCSENKVRVIKYIFQL